MDVWSLEWVRKGITAMAMTYINYCAAFSTSEERDLFFELAARGLRAGQGVRYGTAMEHVLATNLGVWGDEHALARDTAEILALELDSWADANGEDRLEIPPPVLAQSKPFMEAFTACRGQNLREIDHLVQTGRDESLPAETDVTAFLGEGFIKDLYFKLCSLADQYQNLAYFHRDRVSRLMNR